MSHLYLDIRARASAAAAHPWLGAALIKMAFGKAVAISREPIYRQFASGREGAAGGAERAGGGRGSEAALDGCFLPRDHCLGRGR